MKKTSLFTIVLSLAISAAPMQARAAQWFAAPAGTGTACTQAAPCALQQAVVTAASGDVVYLAAGIYIALPFTTEVVSVTRSLKLKGGWDGTTAYPPVRSGNPGDSILDGEGGVRVVKVQGPDVTVTLDGLAVFRGLSSDRGGGVWVSDANLTLRNTLVLANKVSATAANNLDFGGGGVYITGGRLKVVATILAANGALNTSGYNTYGGAILLHDALRAVVKGSIFLANDAREGSGIGMRALDPEADPTRVAVRRSFFIGNGLGDSGSGLGTYGGGISLERAASAIFRCGFEGNAVTAFGSAVYQHYGMLKMDRNVLIQNSAGTYGAVVVFDADGRLRNNVIADNYPGSHEQAAAVYLVRPGVKVTFVHNTIVGPSGGHRGSGVTAVNDAEAVMVNNVLARLDEGVYAWSASDISLDGTLWGDGAWANGADTAKDGSSSSNVVLGEGNVTGDPAFLDPGIAGFYRIGPTSAARNAALPTRLAVDVDGEPRGLKPDIGADEYMTRVLLLAPNGGQRLREGSIFEVRWGAPVKAETFKLSYSLNGGATWKLIAKGVTGRSYSWSVPQVAGTSGECLVRVIGYRSGGGVFGSDVSDAVFTIRDTD